MLHKGHKQSFLELSPQVESAKINLHNYGWVLQLAKLNKAHHL